MNNYERAVIEAARNYRERARYEPYASTITLECAVDALVKHEQVGSLDRLHGWLADNADIRAANSMRRNVRDSGRKQTGDQFAGRWPEKITTAEQVGELPAYDIRDAWHAGPKTWAAWAAGLRAIGIEPAWARELGV